ncbi:MAG: signal transduction histidine kinase/CheY-like chemotaxis protein [Candidatus Krumholzibacteriia bacterium]|jgi:signal transduction histidine kinase/CheY-like chemotaxis protein
MGSIVASPFLWIGAAVVAAVALYIRNRRLAQIPAQEIEDLHAQVNQLKNQLNQAHRMEAVGMMAGSIVNNLNNLMSVMVGHARIAARNAPAESETATDLAQVLKAGRVAGDLIRDISAYYHQADQAREPTHMLPIVQDTIKFLHDIMPSSVEIVTNLEQCGPVLATSTGVQQIMMNLSSNAVNAMAHHAGAMEVGLAEVSVPKWRDAVPEKLAPGRYVKLSVRDNGRGMEPETLEHIFDSYFTTQGDGKDMGIGLSTVYRILQDHGCSAIVASKINAGTSIDIYFPLIAWQVDAPQKPLTLVPDLPPPAEGLLDSDCIPTHVLLVDDDEMVCHVLATGLRRLGFQVDSFFDSREALASFSLNPARFDVVVTDQIMPHMSGVRLTRKLLAIRDDIPILLTTGFHDSFNECQARDAGVRDILFKPANHVDLAQMIAQVVPRAQQSSH